MFHRLINLWKLSDIEVSEEKKKKIAETLVEKPLSKPAEKRLATIISLEEELKDFQDDI